ncbi:MAG: AmmeMemoRadiSam system protein A [Candidatus Moranbacteria bacterium]|nr:AmmeMemoRadiSam system protein A [Candidatus Moranbacteria bacterium]
MNPYKNLAKKAVEEYVKTGKKIAVPEDLPREFYDSRAGVFVTLSKKKKLRGCIGTVIATEKSLAKEIIENAISAAVKDNRFDPVKEKELNDLSYEISILQKPKTVKSLDELDPKKYGLIIRTANGKSGLLLPEIEEIDSVEKQIAIAASKGGIDPRKEQIELYRFEVNKF